MSGTRSGIIPAFGVAASLIAVLLRVYYPAQIFMFGAGFTWIYSHRYGSRRPQPGATPQRSDADASSG